MTRETRASIIRLFAPFLAFGFQYPSHFFPATHLCLPFCPHIIPASCSPPTRAGLSSSRSPLLPPLRMLTYAGRTLVLAAPPLVPAATLLVSSTVQAQMKAGLRADLRMMSAGGGGGQGSDGQGDEGVGQQGEEQDEENPRARSLKLWLDSPSLAFDPSSKANDVTIASTGSPNGKDVGNDDAEDIGGPSDRHDEDWGRVVGCGDPWGSVSSVVRGRVYSPGAMCGTWSGVLSVRSIVTIAIIAISLDPWVFKLVISFSYSLDLFFELLNAPLPRRCN